MATRNKLFLANEMYFITFTILGWKKLFINDQFCSLIYKWFDYIRDNYNNSVHAYVIMPNHIHCIIKVTNRFAKLPILIMNAKRFMAYKIIKLLIENREKELISFFRLEARTRERANHKVFTDGYDSLMIQSRKMFLQKLNYIHYNPCKEEWNLANNPEDYKYSSAANYILDKGYYKIEIIDF